MGGIVSALGQLGSQFGEASVEKQQEDLKRAAAFREMNLQDAYLQLQKQAGERAQQEFETRKKQGKYIDFGGRPFVKNGQQFKTVWNTETGGPEQIPLGPGTDSIEAVKRFIATMPTEMQPGLAARAKAIAEDPESKPGEVLREVMRQADEQQKEARQAQQRKEDKAEAATVREKEYQERRKDRIAELAARRSEIESFQKELFNLKRQGLTPAAEKVLYTVEPVISQVDRLQKDIKDLGLEKNNQNGYLFMSRLGYALGKDSPEGTLAKDIAGLSLGSVIEAASAIQGTSRSLQALKLAQVHTPNAWKDSPSLINSKLTEIRKRLADIMADAKKYGTKSGIPDTGGESPEVNPDPLGVLK